MIQSVNKIQEGMYKGINIARRRFLQVSGAEVLGHELLRSGGNIFSTPQAGAAEVRMPVTPDEALTELMEGNSVSLTL